jgi:two-component system CheB/CheR fusion protein
MPDETDQFKEHEPSDIEQPIHPSTDQANNGDEAANDFPIIGIGASAGGLAAFEQFFTAMPPDTGMAFVVVQHLSADHISILPQIIQRYTAMPVTQVTEGIEVNPNSIYVIPPGYNLALLDGHLTLLQRETEQGTRLAIDFFFRSLAQVRGASAIGVVLSGTGSDGSLGLKMIKAEGGLTVAQDPGTAEFGDMPRNAIATKEVDFILPPERIGDLILKYTRHQVLDGYQRGESDFQIPRGGLQNLYYLLRSRTGHDFSLYKQNTLLRRIERRMKICLVQSMDEYITRLENHPEEIEALFQEILINVTHFFRDQEAFQALTEKAIRPLIRLRHATHAPLRVWVAGCSSGEEAYSVAIAIQEQLEALKTECAVQIFATDLDEEAIAAARKGFYSDGSLENVSAERLGRFFYQEEDGYQVKKPLRDRVVFSPQNVISDPPFSKIDLLCCRNLLIYLEHELQNQLFLQFHYSLNPEGFLFLGNSESISGNSDLFAVIDRKHKIFQRKEAVTRRLLKTKIRSIPQQFIPHESESLMKRPVKGGLREWAEKALLEFHSPACVIIDQKHNILFIHGRTGKYLEPVPGEMNANLIRMAREGLKTELATAIHAATANEETIRREGVQVKTNGDYQAIHLTVRPVEGLRNYDELMMVVFEEAERAPASETASQKSDGESPPDRSVSNRQITHLQKELKEKDDYLHTIIDELEDTNQDLKSTNEELQSINEEMQSANEELETSKEELQSINEELSTINAELQNKNEELTALNNDIYNLLSSIEIGTIFLDLDLRIRRFTPTITRIYKFLPADVGRPIDHFVSSLDYDHLEKDIRQVLRNLVPKAIEVQSKDGAWYLINIKPYRTVENVIDGAVITFVDISEQKRGDELRRLGTILRDSNDAVTVQDFHGKILAWNRGAAQMYGWTETEALAMNAFDTIPRNKRGEAVSIYQRLAGGETIRSFETQRVTRDGKTLTVWITLTVLVDDAKRPVAVASTERDISDRIQDGQTFFFENRALKALNAWYDALLGAVETTPQSLAEMACRALVEESGYRMAWIGRVENEKAKTTQPVAWVGIENTQLESVMKTGQEAIDRALSSRQPVVGQHTDALEHKAGSFLALPILSEQGLMGVLVIYAAKPEPFLESEVEALAGFCRRVAEVMGPEW